MTQKYDKVVWQDETTSQQGTLINAERLDQMQTAHHYADGFEEVDEVPTEDPGVDYHKVVYCTADTTFYRWNGEEWTKDTLDTKADKATTLAGYGITDAVDLSSAQTITGVKTFDTSPIVPTETTGTFSTKAANSTKISNELNAYLPMVRTTGNQTIDGIKTFNSNPKGADPASGATDTSLVTANWVSQTGDSAPNNLVHRTGNESIIGDKTIDGNLYITQAGSFSQRLKLKNENDELAVTPSSDKQTAISFIDKNGDPCAMIAYNHLASGQKEFALYLWNTNNVRTKIVLGTIQD